MAMRYYQPKNVKQGDGSHYQWVNCTMAAGSTGIDRHTVGRIKSTGAKLRAFSGVTKYKGTSLTDLENAWARGYSQDLDVRYMMPWNDFVAFVKMGHGAVIAVWYGELKAAHHDYRCQFNFVGNHAIYINEIGTMADPHTGEHVAAGKMFDPLCNAPKWVPLSVLKAGCASVLIQASTGWRVGKGYCYAGFTRRVGIIIDEAPGPPPPPPGSVPTLILTKPPTPSEVNPMIPGSGLLRTSSHVMTLKKGQPIYRTPGGLLCVKMAADGPVEYYGPAGGGWRMVEVTTGSPYADGVSRPTLAYVPAAAGPVSLKTTLSIPKGKVKSSKASKAPSSKEARLANDVAEDGGDENPVLKAPGATVASDGAPIVPPPPAPEDDEVPHDN